MRDDSSPRCNDSIRIGKLVHLVPKMVMDRLVQKAPVYGQLSSDVSCTKNIRNNIFLIFPLKLCADLVDIATGSVSKLPGVSSLTPVGNYLIKLSTNNCLYLYTGDILMAQINAPQLITVSK